MLTIAAPCPRCGEPRTTHQLVFEGYRNSGTTANFVRDCVVQCTHCRQLSIARVEAPGNATTVHQSLLGNIANLNGFRVLEILPHMPTHKAPEHVPDAVGRAYVEGLKILASGMWTPAAGSFRTSLDRATKILWRQAENNDDWKKDLSPRIQALRTKLSLPEAITDWAHQVRIVGNEIHDLEDVEEEDARDVARFTELFLTYTFTLPKRLDEFRARRVQAQQG